ncbi:hypothetical protein GCM10011320_18800 [Neoroseomonas lacus]|uniref:Uncharacterized protein n=2 Tax=Neoroseomonas lacus TaxID=287609 RepID=A0A917NMG4_9PROT|nr:hypothetical protein GCM10011320_18800 [Neoroseomonas lacus]
MARNPFMSLWLSAANRAANTGRGLAMSATRRQRAAAAAAVAKEATTFWTRAWRGATTPRRSKNR